jgi:hypothetical protein
MTHDGDHQRSFRWDADETRARRDLLRQIGSLERQVSELAALHCVWRTPRRGHPQGPALLSLEQLEQVRDELFTTLADLKAVIAGQSTTGTDRPSHSS